MAERACIGDAFRPKPFLETATVVRTVAGADDFGVTAGQPSIDFAVSQARKQKVVEQLYKGLAGLMRRRGITTYRGTGTLLPGRRVQVEGADGQLQLSGRHVMLAPGSVARSVPGFDVDGSRVLTSDEVLALDALPASAAIIGGGVIGCEFASMFSDLGVQVTVLEAMDTILPECDRDDRRVAGPLVSKAWHRRAHRRPGQGTSPKRLDDDGVLRQRRRSQSTRWWWPLGDGR